MPLTNSQYNTIMRQYEARQLTNAQILQQRKKDAYRRSPRLKALEEGISALSVSRARSLLDGDESALSLLKKELHQLFEEKKKLLNELGYPADYFTLPCQCPDCRDTGYIGTQKCHCFLQAAIDLVYTQSNLRRILQEENFDTFSMAYYSSKEINETTGLSSLDCARQAVAACRQFIRDFDAAFGNLLLYGDTGIGKTFLSHCVAKELLDSGHSVIYFTAFELFRIFEHTAFGRENGVNADEQNLFDCDLLIIDDLGTELSNSFTSSQMFLCLNERILRQKSTIISTNLNIPQLAETYSERTFSRITSHYTMLKMFGQDIRILKKLHATLS